MKMVGQLEDSSREMRTARCVWCRQRVRGVMSGERFGARWLIVGSGGRAYNIRKIPLPRKKVIPGTATVAEIQGILAAA